MKVIRYTFLWLVACLVLSLVICAVQTGCTTDSQRTAFQTIGSVDAAADAAWDGYMTGVLNHSIPTNDIPRAKVLYEQVEKGCQIAAEVAQNGTNSVSPAALTAELGDLVSFLSTLQHRPTR